MTQFSLSMPDREPLEFEGKLLVRVQSQRVEEVSGCRRYDLSVYSRDSGGFVTAIDFVTTVPEEESQSLVETVDSLADVEDFFFAFEPDELLSSFTKSRLTVSQRQELLQRLYAKYDNRVKDVLDQLRSHDLRPVGSRTATK